jgi:anaerobic selenocysteine-containing dehydrogenase
MMKGKDRCTLLMHDNDAKRRDVKSGDHVTVTSEGWPHRGARRGDERVNTNVLSPPTFTTSRPVTGR